MTQRSYDQSRNRSLLGKIKLTYNNQRKSSRVRGHVPPAYTMEELMAWMFENNYQQLHDTWVANNYERYLSPSCDRLDNTLPYALNNLKLATWRDNLDNQKRMNKDGSCVPCTAKPVNQLALDGTFIARHESAAIALRAMTGSNKSISNITQVCSGKWFSAYGYKWEFAETIC